MFADLQNFFAYYGFPIPVINNKQLNKYFKLNVSKSIS